MGGIITWGVGQEGMLTNCAKFPPLVTHVLMSKKTRYFLSLKIEKNSHVIKLVFNQRGYRCMPWRYCYFSSILCWGHYSLSTLNPHKLMFSQRKILNKFHESVLTIIYYSFKIFPQFWLAKSTCIIHHNQLLMTKFGRILCLTGKWRQNAACYRLRHHYQEDLGMRLSCSGCEKKNAGHFTRFKSKNYSWN